MAKEFGIGRSTVYKVLKEVESNDKSND
ncbi:hypothetical protein CN380_16280 [Bacillus sp. AFS017274]|nr:hypothetical protein CN380_16280 [Bacillus sp. AFS017274]